MKQGMRRKVAWFGGIALLAAGLALGYAGWKLAHATHEELCSACRRPVHPRSRTVGLLADRRVVFCCPACALSEHHQTGKRVQLIELTDYMSDAKLPPERAYLVQGSDVNLCIPQPATVDESKQPAGVRFDRCAPGLLAFARQQDAARFADQHGGQMVSATRLVK
jgi:hypothetical protein